MGYTRQRGVFNIADTRSQSLLRSPWTVFLVALLFRGLVLLELSGTDPYFSIPIVDEQNSHHQALSIAAGDILPQTPYWKPPLYPHLLAPIYWLFAHEPQQLFEARPGLLLGVKILQVVLDAFTAFVQFRECVTKSISASAKMETFRENGLNALEKYSGK